MENLNITEIASDGSHTVLCVSDALSRLFSRVETIYGKETGDVIYKIEMYPDGAWVVRHTYILYERDDVEKLIHVNDL